MIGLELFQFMLIFSNLYFQDLEYTAKNNEESILLRNIENSTVKISGNCSSFTIENSCSTTVLLDMCVFGAAMVRNCNNCRVTITSRQLRIRNVHASKFYVSVCSKIALEESTGLEFYRNPAEAEHQTIMNKENMKIMNDSYKEINDFEWPDQSTPSPHWKVGE